MNKKNFKKIDLINYVSSNTGFSYNFSKKMVSDLLNILNNCVCNGYLNLEKIGTFKIIKKNERIGRNPKTKEEFIISARKTIKFTASNFTSEYFKKHYE